MNAVAEQKQTNQQEEDGLSPLLIQEITDSFRAYVKHMVNPSLKGLFQYINDELRHYFERPQGKKQWAEYNHTIERLWANR